MLDQHSVVFGSMLVDSMKNVRWIVFGFSIEGRRVFDRRSLNVWKMLHGFSVGRSIDVQSMTAKKTIERKTAKRELKKAEKHSKNTSFIMCIIFIICCTSSSSASSSAVHLWHLSRHRHRHRHRYRRFISWLHSVSFSLSPGSESSSTSGLSHILVATPGRRVTSYTLPPPPRGPEITYFGFILALWGPLGGGGRVYHVSLQHRITRQWK